ncbi:MAG: acyl-CoA thioesterase [Planctomycetes bacterium]|nr:acyl-CoA thioesterase [Planctomycetota bacterium]
MHLKTDRPRPAGEPAIKVLMMPRDANVHQTIFGGVILSHIDQAGAVHARYLGCERVVTVTMQAVTFELPVYVGDTVSFFTATGRIGRTSITVLVDVWAHRFAAPHEEVPVTTAEVTYVNVGPGPDRRPIPVPR